MLSRKWPQRKHRWLNALADKKMSKLYVSPKLDGVRCTASMSALFSKCGQKIDSLDHIFHDTQLLLRRQFDGFRKGSIILDGELYAENWRPTLGEVLGNVGKRRPVINFRLFKLERQISLYLFDAYFVDHPDMPYIQRIAHLQRLYKARKATEDITNIFLLPRRTVSSEAECDAYLHSSVAKGYEGIVVRTAAGLYYPGKRSSNVLKYLYWRKELCTICDVIEGKLGLQNTLGSIVCETSTGKIQNVNFSLDYDKRKYWWENREKLKGRRVVIKTFTHTGGDIRFGSVHELVVEEPNEL
ncbi:DNA ligase [Perkinsela sp. CCAP 1560/4]|nr:DNA ligase [Perkinsela sp. CCAP 1560/4]|eukprot:KNH08231.1 DNA ligase [Perkinsela sp. CCAP 1560/4]